MSHITHPLYKELMNRPLTQIKHSGSLFYQAFWDGFNGNPHRKYTKGGFAWISWKAGQDKARLENIHLANCIDKIIH